MSGGSPVQPSEHYLPAGDEAHSLRQQDQSHTAGRLRRADKVSSSATCHSLYFSVQNCFFSYPALTFTTHYIDLSKLKKLKLIMKHFVFNFLTKQSSSKLL